MNANAETSLLEQHRTRFGQRKGNDMGTATTKPFAPAAPTPTFGQYMPDNLDIDNAESLPNAKPRLFFDEFQRLHIRMSRSEYESLPEQERKLEWVNGWAIEMIAPTLDHGQAIIELALAIRSGIPELLTPTGPEIKMPFTSRIPDLVALKEFPDDKRRLLQPPDLVVEVLSSSTRKEDQIYKAHEYLEFGVSQYWIVDLRTPVIVVQQNAGDHWTVISELTRDNPTAEIPIGNYGSVHLDLTRIAPTSD